MAQATPCHADAADFARAFAAHVNAEVALARVVSHAVGIVLWSRVRVRVSGCYAIDQQRCASKSLTLSHMSTTSNSSAFLALQCKCLGSFGTGLHASMSRPNLAHTQDGHCT